MPTAAATFTSPMLHPERAVAGLAALGFEFGTSRLVQRALLDTFDGRLHRAGLRLELRTGVDIELILSGGRGVPTRSVVSSAPRFINDLPAGSLRDALAAVVDGRALLPVVVMTATRTGGTKRDGTGRVVASAALYEQLAIHDRGAVDLARWTIEFEPCNSQATPTDEALDALARLGLSRLHGDTLGGAVAAAEIDLSGFCDSPTVALDGDGAAIDGFRAVLSNLAGAIVANWQGVIDQIDTEFLHDLRVAVRRTRTVVAQGKRVLPPSVVEQRAGFNWLGNLTGPARDLDVFGIQWESYIHPLGAQTGEGLLAVRAVLERRRQSAIAAVQHGLRSEAAAALMKNWLTWLGEPQADQSGGIQAKRPLGRVVATRIALAQKHLIERGRLITPDTAAAQVHDLRKDAKKLRHLLECFGSLLPDAPQRAFVRRLKAFQDALGEHQDAEVHEEQLLSIAREFHQLGAAPPTTLAIGRLAVRLEHRRSGARERFAERFAAYDCKTTRRALDAALDGLR